jgi:hypothetical protein
MKTTANEDLVVFQNGNEVHAIVDNTITAAKTYENPENPVAQISRTRVGLDVLTVEAPKLVPFRTDVTPGGAVAAGCRATPTAYQAYAGSEVVFQALPGAGYVFSGWYLGGVECATEAIAALSIPVPADGETEAVYEARFVLA